MKNNPTVDAARAATAREVVAALEALRDNRQRKELMRFFKTGPGEYGEGDEFLGLRVPQTRQVAVRFADLDLGQVGELLGSPWHEARLCALLILVRQFEWQARERLRDNVDAVARRDRIIDCYLAHADCVNNWDLVDLSAPKLLGRWLLLPTAMAGASIGLHTHYKVALLDRLVLGGLLWRQRIAMVSTLAPTREGDPAWCLRYAERLLSHRHDLMHKAVGWMLREMGKHVSIDLLRQFVGQHLASMAPTTLRYAIERLPEDERRDWLDRRRRSRAL